MANKTQLAKSLGISRTQLYNLSAKGMPTNSLSAAKEWRRKNLDIMQTKNGWRVGGNTGVKCSPVKNEDNVKPEFPSDDLERDVLTDVVPEIWFDQVGWLGCALKDHDVTITAEQLIRVQQTLFMIYMEAVTEYLEKEEDELYFKTSPILKAQPGDEIYPSLMTRLNQILDEEPTHQNQS